MDSKIANPVCPFWKAASTDQRAVDPNAPAPLKADGRNSIGAAAEMLEYHAGFTGAKKWAVAELLVVAANKGFFNKIRGLVTQSFTPNHLSGGLLDKELDTGMLHGDPSAGIAIGDFSQAAFEAMFSPENSSMYVIDGQEVRGMSDAQLTTFVEKNAKKTKANGIHTFMAHAEMKDLLLATFGRDATAPDGSTVKIITQRAVEVFFKEGIFPHARLDAKIDQLHPSAIGARSAAGEPNGSVERMVATGMRNGCPMMGMAAQSPSNGTPNPAFQGADDAEKTNQAR